MNPAQMSLAVLELPAGTVTLHRAAGPDVGAIVALLANDQLRASVESTALEDRGPYDLAFEANNADPAQRVHSDLRGNGLDGAMITWAIAEGRRRGALMVRLTPDRTRLDAHRFSERRGFSGSHLGFKLAL